MATRTLTAGPASLVTFTVGFSVNAMADSNPKAPKYHWQGFILGEPLLAVEGGVFAPRTADGEYSIAMPGGARFPGIGPVRTFERKPTGEIMVGTGSPAAKEAATAFRSRIAAAFRDWHQNSRGDDSKRYPVITAKL